MNDPSGLTLTSIATFSFLLSVLTSLTKSAHVHLSATKFEAMLSTEKAKRNFKKYLQRGTQILMSLIVLTTVSNIAFVVTTMLFFAHKGAVQNKDIILALVLSMLPLLIFAKAIPEALAKLHAERVMLWAWHFSRIIYWLLFSFVYPVYLLTQKLESLFKTAPTETSAAIIQQEIMNMVTEGQKEGVLQQTEKDMITAVIELRDREVQEVMTPRIEMFSISLETPLHQALASAIQNGHSRVPIYKESRDNIVGILNLKDLLKYWDDAKKSELQIENVMRQPYFVPESKSIGSLLSDFQKEQIHMAIVIDEYGGTAGIITVEDILEEIVGDIRDEYDRETAEPIIRSIGENIVELDARVHVEDLNEFMHIHLPLDNGYETIGGFLFTLLGTIPTKGEVHRHKNVEFTILEANPRKIQRVKVIKTEEDTEEV